MFKVWYWGDWSLEKVVKFKCSKLLYSSAKDLGKTGYDNEYGYGLVDALEALEIR